MLPLNKIIWNNEPITQLGIETSVVNKSYKTFNLKGTSNLCICSKCAHGIDDQDYGKCLENVNTFTIGWLLRSITWKILIKENKMNSCETMIGGASQGRY